MNENETNVELTNPNGEGNETPTTFTKEELESYADKRVTQALKTQQAKYEKQLSLSKLDGIERERAEKDNEIAELRQRLADYEIEKNRSELKSVLAAHGLSAEFCDLIHVTDDLEESQSKIDKLEKLFKAAVSDEVKKRLSSSTPSFGTGSGENVDFAHMSLSDKAKLFNSDPDQYKRLAGY